MTKPGSCCHERVSPIPESNHEGLLTGRTAMMCMDCQAFITPDELEGPGEKVLRTKAQRATAVS